MICKFEFQISNFCNRKCEWCPPFRDNNIERIEYIDEKILYKMKDIYIKYNNLFEKNIKISFGRYNEPCYNMDNLIKCVNIFKNIDNDKIKFTINTNGDYLNKNNINNLFIFSYVTINKYNSNEKKIDAICNLIDLFGTDICKKLKFNDKINEIYFTINNTSFTYVYNKGKVMNTRTRGGILSPITDKNLSWKNNIKKNTFCDIVGHLIMIDYNGDVFPCCEVTGMNNFHKKMCVGNILTDNFLDIYSRLINFNINITNDVCSTCTAYLDLVK